MEMRQSLERLNDEWASIAEISFSKSHFKCTLYQYILTGEEDFTQLWNTYVRKKFPHVSEYKDGRGVVLRSLIRSLNEKIWQNFGLYLFFLKKGKSYMWTKASLVLLVNWHILENRIAAHNKSNETERIDKTVGCDLVFIYRVFQNFTVWLNKHCSSCQWELVINSCQKKLREEKDQLKELLRCYCETTTFTFHITAYSAIYSI